MAKIKVKLRLSRIEGKSGTICYSVSHRRAVRCIKTDIRIMPATWDEQTQRIVSCQLSDRAVQNRIDTDVAILRRIVGELASERHGFTVADIVARFHASDRRISVMEFLNEQIDFLNACKRLGTAINYRRAADKLAEFLDGRRLHIADMTTQFVDMYADWLLCGGLVRNSVSFHMRILRAVYNKAVRRGLAEQTFPFLNVYTGIDRTRKRAVGEHIISRLMRLDIPRDTPMALARDMFLFSFYTRGMAFVDMVYLRKSDIEEGIIRYARHKTGQQLAVRVEPCMREIIDRYAHRVCHVPYIFPILDSDEHAVSFRQYKLALRRYNNRLHRLSQMLQLDCPISSYTSRHSWATMARNHNVPVSVISAGMGHASERTTQIYLTSLENSVVDNANRGILEVVNNMSTR